MADAVWYVGKEGQQKGPFTEEDVRGMISRGELAATDLVWKEGMGEWQPLGEIEEFADAIAKAPPPPPKAAPQVPAWCKKWWETFRNIIVSPDTGLEGAAEEKPPWFALTWIAATIVILALVALQQSVKARAGIPQELAGMAGPNPAVVFLRALVKGVVLYGISLGALMLALVPVLKSQAGWAEALAILGLASLPLAVLGLVAFVLAWIHLYFYALFVPAIVAQALFFYHVLLHTSKVSQRAALYTVPAIYLGVFIIYGLLTLAMSA